MTKKDFQALAVMLYEARITAKERQQLALTIADVCKRNNPNFDYKKFYEAAGVVPRAIPEVTPVKTPVKVPHNQTRGLKHWLRKEKE